MAFVREIALVNLLCIQQWLQHMNRQLCIKMNILQIFIVLYKLDQTSYISRLIQYSPDPLFQKFPIVSLYMLWFLKFPMTLMKYLFWVLTEGDLISTLMQMLSWTFFKQNSTKTSQNTWKHCILSPEILIWIFIDNILPQQGTALVLQKTKTWHELSQRLTTWTAHIRRTMSISSAADGGLKAKTDKEYDTF